MRDPLLLCISTSRVSLTGSGALVLPSDCLWYSSRQLQSSNGSSGIGVLCYEVVCQVARARGGGADSLGSISCACLHAGEHRIASAMRSGWGRNLQAYLEEPQRTRAGGPTPIVVRRQTRSSRRRRGHRVCDSQFSGSVVGSPSPWWNLPRLGPSAVGTGQGIGRAVGRSQRDSGGRVMGLSLWGSALGLALRGQPPEADGQSTSHRGDRFL